MLDAYALWKSRISILRARELVGASGFVGAVLANARIVGAPGASAVAIRQLFGLPSVWRSTMLPIIVGVGALVRFTWVVASLAWRLAAVTLCGMFALGGVVCLQLQWMSLWSILQIPMTLMCGLVLLKFGASLAYARFGPASGVERLRASLTRDPAAAGAGPRRVGSCKGYAAREPGEDFARACRRGSSAAIRTAGHTGLDTVVVESTPAHKETHGRPKFPCSPTGARTPQRGGLSGARMGQEV